MVIEISNEAKELMEERGIQEADVKEVVEYAETTQKLYEEGGSRSGLRDGSGAA